MSEASMVYRKCYICSREETICVLAFHLYVPWGLVDGRK